jgi:hypothetical protein
MNWWQWAIGWVAGLALFLAGLRLGGSKTPELEAEIVGLHARVAQREVVIGRQADIIAGLRSAQEHEGCKIIEARLVDERDCASRYAARLELLLGSVHDDPVTEAEQIKREAAGS